MTEQTPQTGTIMLAGRVLGFQFPTKGQYEAMVRLARTLSRGSDDSPQDFWEKQIVRVGTLLENLVIPADRELLDELYLSGRTDSDELMGAILKAIQASVAVEDKSTAKPKAVKPRVRRN